MSQPVHVKATHKAIQAYYDTLNDYRDHGVGHETALRSASQNLLAEIAKTRHWLLVPDGTRYDQHNPHRGYCETEDTNDPLDAENAPYRPLTPGKLGEVLDTKRRSC